VGGGSASGTGEFHVPIVDATVVQKLFGGREDRHFGGDGDLTEARESQIRVAKGQQTIAIIDQVMTDLVGSFGFDGVDQEKRGVSGVMGA